MGIKDLSPIPWLTLLLSLIYEVSGTRIEANEEFQFQRVISQEPVCSIPTNGLHQQRNQDGKS